MVSLLNIHSTTDATYVAVVSLRALLPAQAALRGNSDALAVRCMR